MSDFWFCIGCIAIITLGCYLWQPEVKARGFIPQNMGCKPCMTITEFRQAYPDIKYPYDLQAVMDCWK